MDDLNATQRARWETNADFWDAKIGSQGNDYHNLLVGPALERLLGLRPDETLLDVACGNGVLARRMVAGGARVVGIDFSETMIANARRRSSELGDRAVFEVRDATDESSLRGLGEGRFDAAMCAMAFMDMATLDPLARALPTLLRPSGRFAFALLHPCFASTGARRSAEEIYRDGRYETVAGVRITRYLTPAAEEGLFLNGQRVPHLYFDRPLALLLAPFFAAGLALTSLEEPAFPKPAPPNAVSFSWRRMDLPPILAGRLEHVTR